jgi:hypothetical protein
MERVARDKHSSLLQKFVTYGRNFFITLAPIVNVINLFTSSLTNKSIKIACLVKGKPFRATATFCVLSQYQLEGSVGSSLACKYQTRLEDFPGISDEGKKKFYNTDTNSSRSKTPSNPPEKKHRNYR